MRFGSEIVRGVRLAAFVFAAALIGLTVYRMLALDDQPAHNAAAAAKSAPAAEPAHVLKGTAKEPPLPPPPGGWAGGARQVPKAKQTVLVALPQEEQILVADAVPAEMPSLPVAGAQPSSPAAAEIASAMEQTAPAESDNRAKKMFKSVKRFLRIGK